MEEGAETTDAIHKVEKCNDEEEDDLCSSQNVHITESSKQNVVQDVIADETGDLKIDIAIDGNISGKQIRRICSNENTGTSSGFDVMCIDVTNSSEPHARKVSEALIASPPDKAVTSTNKRLNKQKMPILACPLRKLEFCAENDLGDTAAKETRSSDEIKLAPENSHSAASSQTNSRIRLYREKGKERALSDGDIHGKSSNSEHDSHGSAESCNSKSAKGTKRWRCDQELQVGSKRMKNHIPGGDGSFMTWISNMVKGLSNSTREESSSLALARAGSSDVVVKDNQENFTCNEARDSAEYNKGFQSIFQSMYCQNTKTSNTGIKKVAVLTKGTKEYKVSEETSNASLPMPFDQKIDDSSKKIDESDEVVNLDASQNNVSLQNKLWILSADLACTSSPSGNNLAENRASNMLVCGSKKSGTGPSNDLVKQVNSNKGYVPLMKSNMPEESNPLSSLWITRLYTRTAKVGNCNENSEEAHDISTSSPKDCIGVTMNGGFYIDQSSSEAVDTFARNQLNHSGKGILGLAPKAETSTDLDSSNKLSPLAPSEKLRSSEDMASVLARRLDALKHVLISENSIYKVTCFYCGRLGHDIHDCPDVTETELEDLLKKLSSLDNVGESLCMCVKCFQTDHWAISCPLASSSSRHHQCEKSARTAKLSNLSAGNAKCLNNQGGKEDYRIVDAGRDRKLRIGFPSYQIFNVESSSKRHVDSNELRKLAGSNLVNRSEGYGRLPVARNMVAPTEMFQAIRKLRLSRSDVLRWMNSNIGLSHLNGFYLRLRLGKSEASLVGTGYHVACITGVAKEYIGRRSNKSILVDIGGMNSTVGSQYISNHDFLEDEIEAWWHRILKAGGKIPTLDELNSKFQDRTNLRC